MTATHKVSVGVRKVKAATTQVKFPRRLILWTYSLASKNQTSCWFRFLHLLNITNNFRDTMISPNLCFANAVISEIAKSNV